VLVADLGGDPRGTFALLSPWEAEPTSMRIGDDADDVALGDGAGSVKIGGTTTDVSVGGPASSISLGAGLETVLRQNDLLVVNTPIVVGTPFTIQLAALPTASRVKA
jgi:hypothetical protein